MKENFMSATIESEDKLPLFFIHAPLDLFEALEA